MRVIRLGHCAGRERKDAKDRIGLCSLEYVTVCFQENDRCDEPDPLVAIDKRVIFNQSEGVGGGHIEDCRLTVGETVFRARQGRIKQALVANSSRAAKRCDQLFVEDKDRVTQ